MNIKIIFGWLAGALFCAGGFLFDTFPALQYLGVLSLIIYGLIYRSNQKENGEIVFVAISYVFLVVINVLSTDNQLDVLIRFLTLAVVVYSIWCMGVNNTRFFQQGLFSFLLISMLVAVLFGEYSDETYRYDVFGIHPNLVGLYALSSVIFASILLRNFTYVIAISVISLYVSVLYSSRASFIAIIIFLSLQFILSSNKKIVVMIILFLAATFAELFFGAMSSTLLLDDEHRGVYSGFSGRLEFWKVAYTLFEDRPLAGYGYGVVEKLLAIPVDNGYVLMLSEIGIIGVLFYVAAYIYFFICAWRSVAYYKRESYLAIGLIFTFLFYLIFERRYLAFGNPLSLAIIFLFVQSIRLIKSTRGQHV